MNDNEKLIASRPSPPVYLAADLWGALGAPSMDFDGYYERNGWANTWSNLLGVVRDRFKLKCGQDVEGEPCVMSAGHLPPHYGASDVGSSEPVPVRDNGEPSIVQVSQYLLDHGHYVPDELRAALRAAGGVR